MPKLALIVACVTLVVIDGTAIRADSSSASEPSLSDVVPMPRVRSDDAVLAAIIRLGYDRSTTFRRIVDLIDASDGIVYVQGGRCGRSVRSCLVHTVTMAGPSRLLRVIVDGRIPICRLIGSIGHELWHAVEVLRQPRLTSSGAVFLFYSREGHHVQDTDTFAAWETPAALEAGADIVSELRARAKERGDACDSKVAGGQS